MARERKFPIDGPQWLTALGIPRNCSINSAILEFIRGKLLQYCFITGESEPEIMKATTRPACARLPLPPRGMILLSSFLMIALLKWYQVN